MKASQFVSFGDPVFGTSDAPVTVVEFFDPNCPHCKTFNTTMKNLTEQYGDQARFVYKPIPLWRRSVNQIAALHAAAKQGQFEAMLDAQFARQQRGGFTDEQLAEIAREIGMNPDPMLTQIRQGAYQQQIQRDRRLAKQAGVSGTPAVVINGRRVARRAKNAQCLEALIEREIERS
jgi:protein-disulfide isomerase